MATIRDLFSSLKSHGFVCYHCAGRGEVMGTMGHTFGPCRVCKGSGEVK